MIIGEKLFHKSRLYPSLTTALGLHSTVNRQISHKQLPIRAKPMPDDVIVEIKQRVDIESVVGETVRLTRAGRNLKGLCPFHSEKTPSFVVYPKDGSYHCFGCGANGDIFGFLMKTEGLDF